MSGPCRPPAWSLSAQKPRIPAFPSSQTAAASAHTFLQLYPELFVSQTIHNPNRMPQSGFFMPTVYKLHGYGYYLFSLFMTHTGRTKYVASKQHRLVSFLTNGQAKLKKKREKETFWLLTAYLLSYLNYKYFWRELFGPRTYSTWLSNCLSAVRVPVAFSWFNIKPGCSAKDSTVAPVHFHKGYPLLKQCV